MIPKNKISTIYTVVVNHEEQYSIWPDYKALPLGWQRAVKTGLKTECLSYIKEVWRDMRPLSLRKKMEELDKNPPLPPPSPDRVALCEKSLVERLCEEEQVVKVALEPEKTVTKFNEALDRDYVHIKFTETKGGTELRFHVDRGGSDFSAGDFDNGNGIVHVEGNATFDYVRVSCAADI